MDSYSLFVVASLLLCIVPGPDMAFLLGCSIARGRRAGMLAALGINLGAYVHLVAAVLGLSAILATSSVAFAVVKWAGACYLVWIGCRAMLAPPPTPGPAERQAGPGRDGSVFWQGFLCDLLNPKVAIFFLAFLPQFVNPGSEHQTVQLFFLGVTVNVIALTVNLALVFCSGAATAKLRSSPALGVWLNRAMGVVFVSLGIRLAREKF